MSKIQVIDSQTGELLEGKTGIQAVRDATRLNKGKWDKLWTKDMMRVVDIIGDGKVRVWTFIMKSRRRSDNVARLTVEEVMKGAKVSKPTAVKTIKLLIGANFMQRVKRSEYLLNQDLIMEGGAEKEISLRWKYEDAKNGAL